MLCLFSVIQRKLWNMQDFQWYESDSGYYRCLPRDMVSIDAHTQLGLTEIFLLLVHFLLLSSCVNFCLCCSASTTMDRLLQKSHFNKLAWYTHTVTNTHDSIHKIHKIGLLSSSVSAVQILTNKGTFFYLSCCLASALSESHKKICSSSYCCVVRTLLEMINTYSAD